MSVASIGFYNTNTSNIGGMNLENQLIMKQQRLNHVSLDVALNDDEKSKERIRLQQQIDELARKLKIEELKKREQGKKKETFSDGENISDTKKEDLLNIEENAEVSYKEGMTERDSNQTAIKISDMLSQNFSLQREVIRKSAIRHNELSENIFEAEIKRDEIKGIDVSAKKAHFEHIKKQYDFFNALKDTYTENNTSELKFNNKIIIRE